MVASFQVGDDASCSGCGCAGPTITVPCCPTRKFPSRLLVATGGGLIGFPFNVVLPPMSDLAVPYFGGPDPGGRQLWSMGFATYPTGVFVGGDEVLLSLQISSCGTDDDVWGLFASAGVRGFSPITLLVDTSGFAPVTPTCVPLFGSYHVLPFADDPHTGAMENSDWWFYE